MKILVVGGGGREHTIIWKIARSPKVDKIYCAPGNGGIAKYAECHPVKATDLGGMLALAKEKGLKEVKANIYSFNTQSQKAFEAVGFHRVSDEWYSYQIEAD